MSARRLDDDLGVLAAVGNVARMTRPEGFSASSDDPVMIGQIHLCEVPDLAAAQKTLEANFAKLTKMDKKNEERSKRVPSGANVRIRVGNLINSEVKMSSVKRTDNLKEIFKIAKATFKSKKCKIKKPTRAFLKISVSGNSSNYEEILRSDALCNEDCVVVSEGDAPDGFEAGSKEEEAEEERADMAKDLVGL